MSNDGNDGHDCRSKAAIRQSGMVSSISEMAQLQWYQDLEAPNESPKGQLSSRGCRAEAGQKQTLEGQLKRRLDRQAKWWHRAAIGHQPPITKRDKFSVDLKDQHATQNLTPCRHEE